MADRSSSKVVVVAALLANLAIAAVKFIAAASTGSSAMLAEGIHSIVDSGDAVLLLVGMRLAARPADDNHPFGYGKDVYFWSLIVAMLIFGVGGGVTAYEGVLRLGTREPLREAMTNYLVLGAAAVFEAISLVIALRELHDYRRRRLPGRSLLQAIHMAKDPVLFTVVLEDTAAMAGLTLAFLGVFLSSALGDPRYDAIASILIGVVLAIVAIVLGAECRGLLVGERALPDVITGAGDVARAHPDVEEVREVNTMQIGPDEVLLTLSLVFRDGATGHALGRAAGELDRSIRGRFPEIKRVFLDAGTLGGGSRPERDR